MNAYNSIQGPNAKKLKEEFGEKSEPLYERLTLYLRYLYKRGWISIRKPEESDIAKTS